MTITVQYLTIKSVDGVLGTWTRGGRMVCTDKSTKLWRHPERPIICYKIILISQAFKEASESYFSLSKRHFSLFQLPNVYLNSLSTVLRKEFDRVKSLTWTPLCVWVVHCLPVWPDGRIKSSPISPKVGENVEQTDFTLKVMLFKKSKQFSRYFGGFCKKLLPKNFKKSPNLVALSHWTKRLDTKVQKMTKAADLGTTLLILIELKWIRFKCRFLLYRNSVE